jgi:ACS family glucarate transporter-like MFS transporter
LTDVGGENAKSEGGHPPTRSIAKQILTNRMLLGIFLAQYCIATLSTYFISWFPSYLVQERHLSILQAGFVASLPAIFDCIGGVSTGFFSDWLLRRSGSLSLARKIPITIGLGLSTSIILCNYTDANAIVVAIMRSLLRQGFWLARLDGRRRYRSQGGNRPYRRSFQFSR